MSQRRVHAYVSGRVQGVFYRDTTRNTACRVGATGWVQNLPDGRVEAIIEGSQEEVDKVLTFMEVGPSRAYVDHIEIIEEDPSKEYTDFQIRYK